MENNKELEHRLEMIENGEYDGEEFGPKINIALIVVGFVIPLAILIGGWFLI